MFARNSLLINFLLLLVFGGVMFKISMLDIWLLIVIIYIAIFVISPITIEDKLKTDSLMASMPLKRSIIVNSRYLFAILIIIIVTLFIVLVGIQFIPIQRNKSDIVSKDDFIRIYNPPLSVKSILETSCYNCHSNNTSYPWYSYIQPVGMFLQSHIDEGLSELNFSEFNSYSSRMKNLKLNSIVNQVKDEKMPLPSYLIIHKEAALSKSEREELTLYINSLLNP